MVQIPKTAGVSIHRLLKSIPAYQNLGHRTILANDAQKYKNYFKISTIRNPFDRLVSMYFWITTGKYKHQYGSSLKKYKSCENFLDNFNQFYKNNVQKYETNFTEYCNKMGVGVSHKWFTGHIPQHKFICDEIGNIKVDFLLRFEELKNDSEKLCQKLNVKYSKLQHINQTKHKNYKDYYNESRVNQVKSIYKKDFEIFGYSTNL